MTLQDYRALKTCEATKVTSLDGATMTPVSRLGDIANKISAGSASAYVTKLLFEEHMPYMRSYDTEGNKTIFINFHFLFELRKQMSGEVSEEESYFSPYEKTFYDEYIDWLDGNTKEFELLEALEVLDFWLIEEVQGHDHPQVSRDYTDTHKWVKLTERVE